MGPSYSHSYESCGLEWKTQTPEETKKVLARVKTLKEIATPASRTKFEADKWWPKSLNNMYFDIPIAVINIILLVC